MNNIDKLKISATTYDLLAMSGLFRSRRTIPVKEMIDWFEELSDLYPDIYLFLLSHQDRCCSLVRIVGGWKRYTYDGRQFLITILG